MSRSCTYFGVLFEETRMHAFPSFITRVPRPTRGGSLTHLTLAVFCLTGAPALAHAQLLTLPQALEAATANNRAVQSAELQRQKAAEDLRAARTHRLPVFSVQTFTAQPLTQLGVTLDQGVLGSYPGTGPIPGRT